MDTPGCFPNPQQGLKVKSVTHPCVSPFVLVGVNIPDKVSMYPQERPVLIGNQIFNVKLEILYW